MARSSRRVVSHFHHEDDDLVEEEATSQDVLRSSDAELPIHAYVPDYLRPVVFPCHGDFCQTPLFHRRLIAQLMAEGFLPIATGEILLPKLHRRRCVIRLPEQLRVRKSVRKKSKHFSLSVNRDFDTVIQGCRDQHGASCWLVPPLVKSFREMHQSGSTDALVDGTKCPVRMYSIEIWNEEGTLVGGELGYTVGSIYTSLTGFCNQNHAGSVQLAALGRLLCQAGFTLWDLGMDMEYKQDLGSQLMLRAEYVQEVKRVRVRNGHVVLPSDEEPINCRIIIDRPQATPTDVRTEAARHPIHLRPVVEDDCDHKRARGSPESVERVPDASTNASARS